MKRPLSSNTPTDNSKKQIKLESVPSCEYTGFSFQKDKAVVETLDASSIDPSAFFQRFISKRKPCVLQTNSDHPIMPSISLQDLVTVAGHEIVQVEKRFSDQESFGQNRTKARQLRMTIQELVDTWRKSPKGELFYLSTQQSDDIKDDTDQHDDDDDDNNDDDDVHNTKRPGPFQTPCAQLLRAKKIEPTLSWGSTLRLESCNLWIGSSKCGSSSGLHHDYHDNFYLLLQGRKNFRLYSPDTAHLMSTHGTIERIHFNGVISYVGSETRADGTSIVRNDPIDEDDESEEDVVLGKGFDYESDDEGDEEEEAAVEVDFNGPDDFDNLVESSPDSDDEDDKGSRQAADFDGRPNSFCRIDPTNVNQEESPQFQSCKECIVELKAGQILYLPAGWFHCVTSFNSVPDTVVPPCNDDQVHVALNYWYHPPDQLDSFQKPYQCKN